MSKQGSFCNILQHFNPWFVYVMSKEWNATKGNILLYWKRNQTQPWKGSVLLTSFFLLSVIVEHPKIFVQDLWQLENTRLWIEPVYQSTRHGLKKRRRIFLQGCHFAIYWQKYNNAKLFLSYKSSKCQTMKYWEKRSMRC